MELFIGWIALSVVAGIVAANKGRSGFGYFLLSMIITPLVGLLLAALMPGLVDASTRKKCPFCAEWVASEAIKCKHCGSSLDQGSDEHIEEDRAETEAARQAGYKKGAAMANFVKTMKHRM